MNNSADTSGTPGYMSPEVMFRTDHSFVSDFYAVGIIMYEFVVGQVEQFKAAALQRQRQARDPRGSKREPDRTFT